MNISSVVGVSLGWYVLLVYSGKEESAKQALLKKIQDSNMDQEVEKVLIPKYKEIVYRDGKKKIVEKKSYPGYLYVRMNMSRDLYRFVLGTPYISGFVSHAPSSSVLPVSIAEKNLSFLNSQEGELEMSVVGGATIDFDLGDKVLIVDGPFSNFSGTIRAIYPEKKRVCVDVEIFGRATPVEIDFFKLKRN